MEKQEKDIIKIFCPSEPHPSQAQDKKPSLFMQKIQKSKPETVLDQKTGFPLVIKLSKEEFKEILPSPIPPKEETKKQNLKSEVEKISQENKDFLENLPKEELEKLNQELKSLNFTPEVMKIFRNIKISDEVLYSKSLGKNEEQIIPQETQNTIKILGKQEKDTVLKINLQGEINFLKEETRFLPNQEANADEISYLFCPMDDLMNDKRFYSILEISYLLRSSFNPHNSLGLHLLDDLLSANIKIPYEIFDEYRMYEIILKKLENKSVISNFTPIIRIIEKLIFFQMKNYYSEISLFDIGFNDIFKIHWKFIENNLPNKEENNPENEPKKEKFNFIKEIISKNIIDFIYKQIIIINDGKISEIMLNHIVNFCKHLCYFSNETCEILSKSDLLSVFFIIILLK